MLSWFFFPKVKYYLMGKPTKMPSGFSSESLAFIWHPAGFKGQKRLGCGPRLWVLMKLKWIATPHTWLFFFSLWSNTRCSSARKMLGNRITQRFFSRCHYSTSNSEWFHGNSDSVEKLCYFYCFKEAHLKLTSSHVWNIYPIPDSSSQILSKWNN